MTTWLCSGQGAQKPGMGADFLKAGNLEVTAAFDTMSDVLGIDLVRLSIEGTEDEINDPVASQALTMAISVGIGLDLKSHGLVPDAVVGFSLGQISALVLCDVLSLKDAAELLKVRANAMARICTDVPGGMMALIGASVDEAAELCSSALNALDALDENADDPSLKGDSSSEILVVANHNAPGQIVISGTEGALNRAQDIWREKGKRGVRLATAGAFHSPAMLPASEKVFEFCQTLDFGEPSIPLICNTDASEFVSADAAERLALQVRSGVLFDESIRALIDKGERDFVELGFGGVLTGLVKRIDRSTSRTSIGTEEELEAYLEEHGKAIVQQAE